MLLPWSKIQTVFLDMDGTLLDLHFDNYFWLDYLPQCYGKVHNLSFDKAKHELLSQYTKHQGQLTWYCIDYWTKALNLPILALKQEVAHLIRWRKHAEFFLQELKNMGKEVILITNAHPKSLALKMQKVNLTPWFDSIISSHVYGYPKENACFWQKLQEQTQFIPTNSLFIDDSISVLRSAKAYGIAYLYAIYQPDSQQQPLITQHEFDVIEDYKNCFAK